MSYQGRGPSRGSAMTIALAATIGATGMASADEGTTKIRINMREAPDLNTRIVTTLERGATVEVLGYDGDYAMIRDSEGNVGYLKSKYLNVESGAVAESAPAPMAAAPAAPATPAEPASQQPAAPPEIPELQRAEPSSADSVFEPDAEPRDADAVRLDKISVTGSRLKRSDIEGALPVAVISREDIDLSGNITVGDILRNTTFNTFGSFRQQSGSSAQSLVSVSLRGLGPERTLVLIDGRRAPKAPFAPTAQDMNAIPLAAIERIEILSDGASAVYGSDALGGVVNLIMRKDFEGWQVSYQESDPSREGGDIKQGQLVVGSSGERGHIVMGASFHSKDIVFARDSLFNTPGQSFFSNNYTPIEGPNEGDLDFLPGGCNDDASVNTGPGYSLIPYVDADGNPLSPSGQRCAFDFNLVAADEAAVDNQSAFARGTYEINDDWFINSMASISNAGSFGRYAPTPGFFTVSGEVLSDNTNGQVTDDSYVYHRFAAVGPRDTETEANVYDIVGELQGRIGEIDLAVGARFNEYKYIELGRNYVVRPLAEQAAADGSYNFVSPLDNDPSVLKGIAATINRESIWETQEYFVDASMPIFEMGGGFAQLAIGAETRTEVYSDTYDSLQEAGVILGSAGNSAGGARDVTSFYAETLFPVTMDLELTAAVRYDDYSDYGDDVSPKVSARWKAADSLTVRASYGQGFRAPTLDILTQQPTFSAESINNDEQTCIATGGVFSDGACSTSSQVDTIFLANPLLDSEKSDQFSIGFAADVTEWMDLTLDYYNITIEDLILEFDPDEILDRLAAGDPIPAGLGITRLPNQGNRIDEVTAGFANSGDLETSGIDLSIDMRFNLGEWGRINSYLKGVYVLDYTESGGRNEVGDPEFPEMRWNMNNAWSLGALGAAWNINFIGDQAAEVSGGGVQSGHIPTYITHDIQVNYTFDFGTTITVGAVNAFDKEPDPRSAADGRNYDFDLYDQYGRTPYFKLTQRF